MNTTVQGLGSAGIGNLQARVAEGNTGNAFNSSMGGGWGNASDGATRGTVVNQGDSNSQNTLSGGNQAPPQQNQIVSRQVAGWRDFFEYGNSTSGGTSFAALTASLQNQ